MAIGGAGVVSATLASATVALATMASATVASAAPVGAQIALSQWGWRLAGQAHQAGLAGRGATGRTSVPAPTIVSGQLLTTKLSVLVGPASPTIRFKFNAPGYYSNNYFGFTGPSGQKIYLGYGVEPPGAEKTGSITFDGAYGPFPIYTQPGIWHLTEGGITDLTGNSTYYNAAQLAALFPSVGLNVINPGPVDLTPPTVTRGKIDTPTVHLGSATPFLKISLTAADDLSGVYETILTLAEPDGTAYPGSGLIFEPTQTLSGTVTAGVLLKDTTLPTGVWTITGLSVCDVAGNCLNETDPATLKKQLGRTSFNVMP